MADKSAIEWTEATWNPVVGCSVVSPGCTNCYAMKMAARLEAMGQPIYQGLTQDTKAGAVWTGKVELSNWGQVIKPLAWKRPRLIFVNSMSDLFHESLPDDAIDTVFAVMALAPQHTFQVLTKRAARMRAYFADRDAVYLRVYNKILYDPGFKSVRLDADAVVDNLNAWLVSKGHLPNVWLGVSAEDQARADERIPDLLATPAAVRWVSAEPLLGPIDFNRIHESFELPGGGDEHRWESALDGKRFDIWSEQDIDGFPRLDWIVVGGESGPKARPMHPDWARSIRDQCAAAGVPFFFKQWGAWNPVKVVDHGDGPFGVGAGGDPLRTYPNIPAYPSIRLGEQEMWRVGKKRAGRLLDGILHAAWPAAASTQVP